jgi:hypothetical protein
LGSSLESQQPKFESLFHNIFGKFWFTCGTKWGPLVGPCAGGTVCGMGPCVCGVKMRGGTLRLWDPALVGPTCGTKRWSAHTWDHALVGPTCGTMGLWGPHVGSSAGRAHMWDRSGGSMLTCNATWMCERARWWGPHMGPCVAIITKNNATTKFRGNTYTILHL